MPCGAYSIRVRAWIWVDAENRRRRSAQVPLAAAWLRLCEAEAARALGEPAPDAWSQAALAVAGLGLPYQLAYARLREAEARLAARGPRSPAIRALVEAHGLAARLGAEPLRIDIEGVARRARVDLDRQRQAADRPPAADAAFGLTARELEVLALLVAGLTNRAIGEELFVSPKTVATHIEHILGKLGASRRMEAAAIAHRLGLIEPRRAPERTEP